MRMRTTNSTRHLNNGGYSLIELIVVIAIMGVLIAAVIATSSVLDGSRVRDAEQGLSDYVSLTRSKSMSVAAKSWHMEITKLNNEYFAKIYKTSATEEGNLNIELVYEYSLGKKVTMTYGKEDPVEITNENYLQIYFNPSTGRVNKVLLGEEEQDISSGLAYVGISSGEYDIVVKVFLNTGKCERE